MPKSSSRLRDDEEKESSSSPLFETAPSLSPDVSGDESDPLLVEHSYNNNSNNTGAGVDETATTAFPTTLTDHPLLLVAPFPRKAAATTTTTLGAAAAALKVNQWLQWYVRFVASSSNQDKLLKLLQWSLWLCGSTLRSTTSSSSGSPTTTPAAAWLHKLYGEVSFARYVTRLLGLPVALEAAVNDSWTAVSSSSSRSRSKTNVHRMYQLIGKVLAYSMVAYHPTELMAYALWMKPKSAATVATSMPSRTRALSPRNPRAWPAETWSYISCRFWLTYVVAELVQCILQWHELREQQHRLRQAKPTDDQNIDDHDDSGGNADSTAVHAQMTHTALQTVRNLLFVLPCVQWSLPSWDTQPWLPVTTIHSLMWAESVVCLYQAWKTSK